MIYYLQEMEKFERLDGIIHTNYKTIGKFETLAEANHEKRRMEYLAEKDCRECGLPRDMYTYKVIDTTRRKVKVTERTTTDKLKIWA